MSETQREDEDQHPVVNVLQTITPGFIRRSFAIKFGLVLLVMALSIGTIGVVATQAITSETESNVEAEFQGDAQQQAEIINQWIDSNTLQTELLSGNEIWGLDIDDDETRDDNLQEIHNELSSEEQSYEGDNAVDMHLIRDDETTGPVAIESTDLDRDTELRDSDERDWFANSQVFTEITNLGSTGVYVSDTYEVGGERVVGFVSPATGDRYLFVEVSVFDVQDSLRGAEADRDVGFTQVVNTGTYQTPDGDENVVMMDARGESGKLLEVYATNEETLRPLERANELRGEDAQAGVINRMSADEDVLDEEYTVGYAPVNDNDDEWVVVTHGPRSEVFGFVDTLSTWGLIVTLVSVLLIGVTGSMLGYSTATSIDRLTKKTDEIREGDLDVNLYSSRVDNIGRLYDGFADMRDALKNQIEESEKARKEAEVARAEAEELARYLQEKAEEYSAVMQEVSAGDLTQRMEQDGEEESMDRIAEEFNQMIEELEKTTGQLKSYVDEVEESGAEVEQSARTVREASEQVADSIQKISDDAYDQKDRFDRLMQAMEELADDIEQIAAQHETVSVDEAVGQLRDTRQELEELAELSQQTMNESEQVAGAAEEQAAELNAVSERANDLQRYAQPLRDILERFETEAEHEFVFSVGPTGGAASPSTRSENEDDD